MSEGRQRNALNEEEIAEISQLARKKLTQLGKLNDIIGTQVFTLLGLHAHVLYYPLDEDGPWGFACLGDGKPFVAINTSIEDEKCVFTAAHELYHIWFDTKSDYIPPTVLDEKDEKGDILDIAELRANRFAAEFLVEKSLLEQEMHIYAIKANKVTDKDILMLADLFSVPYRTMVKRLYEISAITARDRDVYLKKTQDELNKLSLRYSLPITKADGRIALDSLVELAVSQYEKHGITFEKFTYLLRMADLDPAEVGINKPKEHVQPSDDELDLIMEE